jgi:hypothetical protein
VADGLWTVPLVLLRPVRAVRRLTASDAGRADACSCQHVHQAVVIVRTVPSLQWPAIADVAVRCLLLLRLLLHVLRLPRAGVAPVWRRWADVGAQGAAAVGVVVGVAAVAV